MLIPVDFKSTEPIYMQIYWAFVGAIASGELSAGKTLPSSRKLAADLGINYHTANKAYNLLESEGFVGTDKKRTTVARSTGPSREDYMQRWKEMQINLITEAKAKGIRGDEMLALFRKLLEMED
jgi:DNA-binding transcriptional regulator YhcF (GntR family)